jgi:hypothetical protein
MHVISGRISGNLKTKHDRFITIPKISKTIFPILPVPVLW